jgi:Phosphotransferase enzyme family
MAEPSPPPSRWRVAALVGRVSSREILVEAAVDGTRLPIAPRPLELEPFAADALGVVEGMLGEPVVPLRLTWLPAEDWRSGTIVVEVEPMRAPPPGFRWQDPVGLVDALEPEEARAVVRRRLDRLDGGATPLEPPWARAMWFARTSAWMVERMADAGFETSEAPTLVYQGPLAAVLRARSDGRSMFLKCAAPAFAHETSITRALARRTPDLVPSVIASEPSENWLLMHDHGGRLLSQGPEAAWLEAMPRVVELQRSWIGATEVIAAGGGQTRPIADLSSALPLMLDRDDLGGRLAPDVRQAWTEALPRLLDACAALIDLDVPDTLIHGDLHPGNIVLTANGHVVVDWSNAAVGNPFVDLPTFLIRTKDRELRRRLWDGYANGWKESLPSARVDVVGHLAMTVGSLYQVATYQALLPALDPPDRALFDGADAAWLKRTLEAVEHGLDAGLT